MTPGVLKVYKCRSCSQLHVLPTIASFNADHKKYYSDLKPVNTNCPDYSAISVCNSCNELTPLVDQYCEGFYESSEHIPVQWKNASLAAGPDLYGYIKVVEDFTLLEAISEFPQDRRLIARMKIYELFNDRIREVGGSRFIEENDEQIWFFNAIQLLYEIETNDVQSEFSTLLKIDVARSTGKFSQAIDVLDKVEGKRFLKESIKSLYSEACEREDDTVFKFNL